MGEYQVGVIGILPSRRFDILLTLQVRKEIAIVPILSLSISDNSNESKNYFNWRCCCSCACDRHSSTLRLVARKERRQT